jgi:large subunit ribosomal protein L15
VGRLDRIAENITTEKEGKLLVDLESLGFTKLLGTGNITKPLTVRVMSCSKSAAEKVREAGGQVLMETQEQGE